MCRPWRHILIGYCHRGESVHGAGAPSPPSERFGFRAPPVAEAARNFDCRRPQTREQRKPKRERRTAKEPRTALSRLGAHRSSYARLWRADLIRHGAAPRRSPAPPSPRGKAKHTVTSVPPGYKNVPRPAAHLNYSLFNINYSLNKERFPMLYSTLCYIEKNGKYLMLHRVKKENDANHDKWVGI